jgi:sulfur relay (sulfurtransferase) DsrF/TusC family protein
MSRLTEIMENHDNLEQLFALMKHYGVNAEFVSASLLNEFEKLKEEEAEEETTELMEDLTQFYARF